MTTLPTLALAQISGTATVEPAAPGSPFEGFWCYTIEISWTTPQSLSNLSVFVGLENLECACDPGLFAFPSPAGTSMGEEDGVPCTLDYDGEYLCTGNPSLPPGMDSMAAVKFDPTAEPCNAGSTGSGTFVFYSQLAPAPPTTYQDVLVIKNGETASTGDLTGQLPQADCTVDAHDRSWGKVKIGF